MAISDSYFRARFLAAPLLRENWLTVVSDSSWLLTYFLTFYTSWFHKFRAEISLIHYLFWLRIKSVQLLRSYRTQKPKKVCKKVPARPKLVLQISTQETEKEKKLIVTRTMIKIHPLEDKLFYTINRKKFKIVENLFWVY